MTATLVFRTRSAERVRPRPTPVPNSFIEAQLQRRCVPAARIAQLGCGDGRLIGERSRINGALFTGVDTIRSQMEAGREAGLDLRRVPDLATSALPGAAFDVVFALDVLAQVVRPLDVVAEAYRLLRPGGAMVVTVPNAASWRCRLDLLVGGRPGSAIRKVVGAHPWDDPDVRFFTMSSLHALLVHAGFDSVEVGGAESGLPPGMLTVALGQVRPSLFAERCTAVALK